MLLFSDMGVKKGVTFLNRDFFSGPPPFAKKVTCYFFIFDFFPGTTQNSKKVTQILFYFRFFSRDHHPSVLLFSILFSIFSVIHPMTEDTNQAPSKHY